MSDDVEKQLTRQQMIWEGLYGPPQAAEMVARAREALAADPSLDVADVLAGLDPDDEDLDDGGLSRPGVG